MLMAIVLHEVLLSHSVLLDVQGKIYSLAFTFEKTTWATAVKRNMGYIIISGHSNSAVTLQAGVCLSI